MKPTTTNLKTLLTCVLQEQVDKARVNKAYLQTVNAVKGIGTDVPAVLNSIKMLRSRNEFLEYMVKFQDKKTGYSFFPEMINAEYDRLNLSDVQQIVAALRNINVSSNVITTKNIYGINLFSKFQIEWTKLPTVTGNVNSSIYKKQWITLLPKAVLWWKNWLSNPITKNKVQANWDAKYPKGLVSVKYIFPDYFKMLDSLKIKFYDELDPINWSDITDDAYAFVKGFKLYSDNTIYINLTQNDPDPYGTLIHEIQHIIYGMQPLNPEEKIRDIFVTKNTKRATPNSIEASSRIKPDTQTLKQSAAVIKSLGLDMKPARLRSWKLSADNYSRPSYICQATEKMSNIMSIRSHFKLKPGQNITIAMLKPYIERKKTNTDIGWIILCWAKNGFPDLNKMINRINTLAANDTGPRRGTNVA